MSVRLLNFAIWACNWILLGMAIFMTLWAFSAEPAWVKNTFLAWTGFCIVYTLVERWRFVHRRKCLLHEPSA